MISTGERRWTSHRHNEPSKGGSECRPGDCPCGKSREVLRLRFELHLGYQQIGRSCAIGVSTVHKYLKRAEAAGVTWPLPKIGMRRGWKRRLFPRTGNATAQPNERSPAGLRRDPRAVAHTPSSDPATAVGGIPAGQPGRLSLLAFLRAVSALALEARRGDAAGTQGRREDVRRLGGRDDSGLRPAHRPGLAGAAVRGRARRQLLHLGRGHARSADGSVAARPRPRVRILAAAFRRWRFPTTPRPA